MRFLLLFLATSVACQRTSDDPGSGPDPSAPKADYAGCGAYCGDGSCGLDEEDCLSCEQDCGACTASHFCGDAICDESESCELCAEDCCDTTSLEPVEIPTPGSEAYCGDLVCDEGELDCDDCNSPLGISCGDGFCAFGEGEDCLTCAYDCGSIDLCADGVK